MDALATRGPWGPNRYDDPVRGEYRADKGTLAKSPDGGEDDELLAGSSGYGYFVREHDRDVIAALRNVLPELAALVDASDGMRSSTLDNLRTWMLEYDRARMALLDKLSPTPTAPLSPS